MKNKWLKYVLAPFISAVIGCICLALVSCIPQSLIQKNAEKSLEHIKMEPIYPSYINVCYNAYTMDNYTDTLILIGGYNLRSDNIRSILTNPSIRPYPDESDIKNSFEDTVNGKESNSTYVRYWQGFRIFIRPMMVIFPYFVLRQIVSWVFYGLMFLAIAAVAERKGIITSLCIGIPLFLVNPSIVSHSLQFSPCFIMAFVFILFILFMENKNYIAVFAFCIFGILTQFFDFYTAPFLTCGLPLLVYLTLIDEKINKMTIAVKAMLSWMYGWVSMWLVKLLFVTIFTDINGFKDGFGSFATRVGINIAEDYADAYDPIKAITKVWETTLPGIFLKVSVVAIIIVVMLSAVFILKSKGVNVLLSDLSFLLVAAVPFIWFAVAAQPTVIHSYFQYRSIAVFFAGVFLFAAQALPFKEKRFFLK